MNKLQNEIFLTVKTEDKEAQKAIRGILSAYRDLKSAIKLHPKQLPRAGTVGRQVLELCVKIEEFQVTVLPEELRY